MAARFWVGGSGDWNDTAHWSLTSGGAGGQTVPGTSDNVTIDGHASGLNTGTLTINEAVAVQNITWGAAIGTIDNSGNHDVTCSGLSSVWFSGTGTGARTWTGGSGTYTMNGAGGASMFNMSTTTNLSNPTTAFSSATIVINNTGSSVGQFTGGACTYGTVTLSGHSGLGGYQLGGGSTFTTLNVTAPTYVAFQASTTHTITNAFAFTGTAADRIGIGSSSGTAAPTITCANDCTLAYGFVRYLTFAGGGDFTATNSYDLGMNTISGGGAISITEPAGGGASIIGG